MDEFIITTSVNQRYTGMFYFKISVDMHPYYIVFANRLYSIITHVVCQKGNSRINKNSKRPLSVLFLYLDLVLQSKF